MEVDEKEYCDWGEFVSKYASLAESDPWPCNVVEADEALEDYASEFIEGFVAGAIEVWHAVSSRP